MKIIEQSIRFDEMVDTEALLWRLEAAARTCYKSEYRNAARDSAKRDALIRNIIKSGHHSVLEHASITFRVITNRGVTHEWVRHRIGVAYSQESTRYCNYGNDDQGITVIWPWFLGEFCGHHDANRPNRAKMEVWYDAMRRAEDCYLALLSQGCIAQEARGVLPNDLKTEMVCTMNLRALRHFFELRCSAKAHPQIRALAAELQRRLQLTLPQVFEVVP